MTGFKLLTLFVVKLVFLQSIVESRKYSLAFVIDMTRSMTDEVNQIKKGTQLILETFLKMGKQSPIKDYVLQVFRDPKIEDPIKTENPEEFKNQLKELYAFASRTTGCKEMCLTGIMRATQQVRNGSTIYVFTDASSRDFYRYESLLLVLQQNQLKVVFVLTGDCNDKDDPGLKVFYKLARNSGGQVFYMDSTYVLEFVKSLVDTFSSIDVGDAEEIVSNSNKKISEFKVKPEDQTLNIQVTLYNPSEKVKGVLYNPDGKVETEKDGLKIHLKKSTNIYFVTKVNPQPGKWTLKLATNSKDFTRKISIVKNETYVNYLKAMKSNASNKNCYIWCFLSTSCVISMFMFV